MMEFLSRNPAAFLLFSDLLFYHPILIIMEGGCDLEDSFFDSRIVFGIDEWVLSTGWGGKGDSTGLPESFARRGEFAELYLYSISGKQTLTGQHCVPLVGSTRLAAMHKQTRRYPAVFGQDFGFSPVGTWDGINYRQQIVDEAIRRNSEGFIITLMWHAVRPIEEEPVEFRESIQGELTDQEWQDLVTPGTLLNERWKSQVDVIAWFLKQLRGAGIPVLWRPYHEMNGDWFWWGKKAGDTGYKKLYRMLFDRLVNFHRLNNLIWVFNANELGDNIDPYENYFPGHDVVDILATDVYRGGFAPKDYEQLLALAGDKPIALGEVGRTPSPEILRSQPRWTWFMSWGDPSGLWGEGRGGGLATYESQEALTWDELPWVKVVQPRIHYPILK